MESIYRVGPNGHKKNRKGNYMRIVKVKILLVTPN